jgi:hypothetical protein
MSDWQKIYIYLVLPTQASTLTRDSSLISYLHTGIFASPNKKQHQNNRRHPHSKMSLSPPDSPVIDPEQEITRLQGCIVRLREELAWAENHLDIYVHPDKVQDLLDRKSDSINKQEKRIETLQSDKKIDDDRAKELRNESDIQARSVETGQRRIQELEAEVAAKERRIQELQGQVDRLRREREPAAVVASWVSGHWPFGFGSRV